MKFKIGDKVKVKNDVDSYLYTNAGSIGFITGISNRQNEHEEGLMDVKFLSIKNGMKHTVPFVFDIFEDDLELFEKRKVIQYGIATFINGEVK